MDGVLGVLFFDFVRPGGFVHASAGILLVSPSSRLESAPPIASQHLTVLPWGTQYSRVTGTPGRCSRLACLRGPRRTVLFIIPSHSFVRWTEGYGVVRGKGDLESVVFSSILLGLFIGL